MRTRGGEHDALHPAEAAGDQDSRQIQRPTATVGGPIMSKAKMRTAIAAPAQGRKRERVAVTRENVNFHMPAQKLWSPVLAARMCIRRPFYRELAGRWTIRRLDRPTSPRGSSGSRFAESFAVLSPLQATARRRILSCSASSGRSPIRQAEVLLDPKLRHRPRRPRLFGASSSTSGGACTAVSMSPAIPPPTSGVRHDVLDLVRSLVHDHQVSRQLRLHVQMGRRRRSRRREAKRLSYAGLDQSNVRCRTSSSTGASPASVEPMLVVNLGTRGPQDAANLVEYCDHPGGTDAVRAPLAHGWDKPRGVKFWCLGNEMDGDWQQPSAAPAIRSARATATMMRWADDLCNSPCAGRQG